MFKSLFAVGALALASFNASAEYIHADWNGKTGNVTYNSETNKAWLKISETRALNVSSIHQLLGEGGAYEGWRLPTYEEAISMWEGFMGGPTSPTSSNYINVTSGTGVSFEEFELFREYMGGGYWGSKGYFYGTAFFATNDEATQFGRMGFVAQANGSGHYYSPYAHSSIGGDNYSGLLLVNDGDRVDISFDGNLVDLSPEDVPIPLFGVGLLPLLYFVRRKK